MKSGYEHLPPAPQPVQSDLTDSTLRPRVMWLGHASCFLQLPSVEGSLGIMFDPIFSSRCSPSMRFGPKRRMPAPCRVADLPAVHLVVISHDHYDHLDKSTVLDIEFHHRNVQYLVPLGVKRILESFGIETARIAELNWRDSLTLHLPGLSLSKDKPSCPELRVDIPSGSLSEDETPSSPVSTTFTDTTLNEITSIVVTCCPTQHNSGRSLWKRNKTLWASWYLDCSLYTGDRLRVYFAGDTGYRSTDPGPVCPIFKDMAKTLGPPDLALLPIAAGACLPYIEKLLHIRFNNTALTRHLHCPPGDAVDVHRDLQAKKSLGIHWGTFTTSLGARRTRAEFDRVRVEGFDICNPGVWLELPPDKDT